MTFALCLMPVNFTPMITNARPLESVIKKQDLRVFSYVATYNARDFMRDPDVMRAINLVVPKSQIKNVDLRMNARSPIDFISGYVVAYGCMQNACGSQEAMIWYNLGDKTAIVTTMVGGKYVIYAGYYNWWTLPLPLRARIIDNPSFERQPASVKLVRPTPKL
jgi:hypothetical protein